MKFIARNKGNYSVQLDGGEEERNCFAVLAENLYGILSNKNPNGVRIQETYSGQIIEFPNKQLFKKFLLWRSIFNQCAPNKTFSFLSFARKAVPEVRQIMLENLIEIC